MRLNDNNTFIGINPPYQLSVIHSSKLIYPREIYQLGEEIYCEALRHIVAAWEGRPDSFRAAVLRGVMYFVQLYHGQYSAERLVRALRPQWVLMQTQFEHHRPAARLSDDRSTPDCRCCGHAFRHGRVDGVGCSHAFPALKSYSYCAFF